MLPDTQSIFKDRDFYNSNYDRRDPKTIQKENKVKKKVFSPKKERIRSVDGNSGSRLIIVILTIRMC